MTSVAPLNQDPALALAWLFWRPDKEPVSHLLPLTVCLDEVDRWLRDARKFNQRLHKNPWRTAREDLFATMDALGPALNASAPELYRLRTKLQGLTAKPDQAKGESLSTWSGADGARELSSALRIRLVESNVCAAAFADLVAGVKNISTKSVPVVILRNVVLDLIVASGRDVESSVRVLTRILDDDLAMVTWVQAELNGEVYVRQDGSAGLDADARCYLAERFLGSSPVQHSYVIWIGYSSAAMRSPWRAKIGDVDFFDGPSLRKFAITQHAGELPEDPSQLVPTELLEWAEEDLPLHDRWVAARISLPSGLHPAALLEARDLAGVQVAIAKARGSGFWDPMDGALIFTDGAWSSRIPINIPGKQDSYLSYEDTVADEISAIAATAEVPVVENRELLEAVHLLEESGRRLGPASIIVDVRVIEMIASACNLTWQDLLTETCRERFVYQRLRRLVSNTVFEAVNNRDDLQERYLEISQILEIAYPLDTTKGLRHRALGRELDVLPQLAPLLAPHSLIARRVRDMINQSTHAMDREIWTDQIAKVFDHLKGRLARCRNALAHGGPINPQMVMASAEFAHRQASLCLMIVLEGAIDGHASMRQSIDEHTQRFATRWELMRNEPSVHDAFITK